MDEIPQWAFHRAKALAESESSIPMGSAPTLLRLACFQSAFAHYIASHEEEPVDPLMVAAREIVATTQHNWPDSPWHMEQVEALRAGKQDRFLTVMAAYEGLKRGMELAQVSS